MRHLKKGKIDENTHVSRLHIADALIGTGRRKNGSDKASVHGGGNGGTAYRHRYNQRMRRCGERGWG